ncbi:MAG: PIN domain-containing protein [Terriglobales bacterium]
MSVLVDTPVWSLALRRPAARLSPSGHGVVEELSRLIHAGEARLIGALRQEVLSGIRNEAQFEKLRLRLRAFPDEPLGTADYEAAARAGRSCRARGLACSGVDMLICAVARARGWAVFTTDGDFQRYARVLSLRLLA